MIGPLEAATILMLVVWPGTIIWVAIDANNRDWPTGSLFKSAGGWCLGLVLLWVIVFPTYLIQRGKATVRVYGAPAPALPPNPTREGWFPDPLGRAEERYFDGDAWSADVQRGRGMKGSDPAGAHQLNGAPSPLLAPPPPPPPPSIAAQKVCPDCAEAVQPAANVCRHCGYRFDAQPA